MTTAHLTETAIQLYAAEPDAISKEQMAHVLDCHFCQAKAANYTLLFNSIHDMPKPAFDFDLSALVIEQLPVLKAVFPWTAILISIVSALVVAVSAMLFWASIMAVIKSVSIVLLAATITGAVVIMVFQAFEMLKAHYRQMNALLSSKTLQL
jgi:hypothetical protein